jgi:hypothetical protein
MHTFEYAIKRFDTLPITYMDFQGEETFENVIRVGAFMFR